MTKIKGYQIIKTLGKGGMATVYLAKEERLDREVALKILTVQVSDDTFKKSFLAEARLVAQLEHQYIIKIYRTDVESDQFYMEMELLRGGTLKERLKETELNISAALFIIKQIGSALSYAHQKGCIHRDIKPANILFRSDANDVVLADFGIAKREDSDSDLTIAGHTGIGTPNYMAPEQAMAQKVDGRTDMYSLGIVFYEMLTQKKPFQAATTSAIIHNHMTAELPQLPEEFQYFQPVLEKVLSKNKKDRYSDVATFIEALFSAHENNTKVNQQVGDETVPHQREVQKAVVEKPSKTFFVKYRLLIVFLLMSLGLGGGYLITQSSDSSERDIAAFPKLTPNMQWIKAGALTVNIECIDDKDCIKRKQNNTLEMADFLISKTEVSFAQWDNCVAQKGCSHLPDDEGWGRGQQPVINVNWHDIQEYIAWLNKKTGFVYRLPTEAQWLYAAQAGQNTIYPWGDRIMTNKANCDGCKTQWDNKSPAPIASFAAYGGLYDMYGNVGEWTCSANQGSVSIENHCMKDDSQRLILRGGSWQDEPQRLSERGLLKKTTRYKTFGFRLLRTP